MAVALLLLSVVPGFGSFKWALNSVGDEEGGQDKGVDTGID